MTAPWAGQRLISHWDSGASDVSIPADVVMTTLVRAGTISRGPVFRAPGATGEVHHFHPYWLASLFASEPFQPLRNDGRTTIADGDPDAVLRRPSLQQSAPARAPLGASQARNPATTCTLPRRSHSIHRNHPAERLAQGVGSSGERLVAIAAPVPRWWRRSSRRRRTRAGQSLVTLQGQTTAP